MTYASVYFVGMAGKASSGIPEFLYEMGYSDIHLTQQREAFAALEAGKVSEVEYDSWVNESEC